VAGSGNAIYAAASGVKALEVWREHRNGIDIMVTDMVMPEGMNGRELAEQLRKEKPDFKVIYCSGYHADILGKDSPLRNNEIFLQKPFSLDKLLSRVRDCLDAK
jgi:two-component system cell cycle sensor histidine kinase/response regulator CckA